MAITQGTSILNPIDFGVSEWLTKLTGTQIGAYNPAQHTNDLIYDNTANQINQNYNEAQQIPQYIGTPDPTNPTTINYTTNPAATTAKTNLQTQQTQTLNNASTAPSLPGFDMKYYPGWGLTEAMADWTATGGSKANVSAPSAPPAPVIPTYNINGTNVTAPTGKEALQTAGFTNTDYNPQSSAYSTPQEFLDTINSGYNTQSGFLDSQENALKAASDAFNATIDADYTANVTKGGADKSKAKSTLAQNSVQAQQRKQDALNSAKQLYDQLQTGYRQRFGGASSGGEASQAILGAEQQRQSGLIGREHQNTQAQIEAQAVDVENQYQGMIQQLDVQKQTAKRDVLMNTQTQLTSIGQNRVMAEQSKQQAILQLLMDARDKNFSIDQANQQQAKTIELMKTQALINAGVTSSTGQNAIQTNQQTGQTALNQFGSKTQNLTSQVGMSGQPKTISTMQSPTINTAQGAIDFTKNSYDPLNPGTKWWEQGNIGL